MKFDDGETHIMEQNIWLEPIIVKTYWEVLFPKILRNQSTTKVSVQYDIKCLKFMIWCKILLSSESELFKMEICEVLELTSL